MFSPFKGFIRTQVKLIKPDVVLSFGDIAPQLSMVSLIGLRIPFYLSNRSSPAIKYPLHYRLLKSLIYKFIKPNGVIAQTKYAAVRKRQLIGENINIRVIPNLVRTLKFKEVEKQNWIVTIGRLHFEKGLDRLFKVFKLIDNEDWKLVIAGSGKHELQFKSLALEMNIFDRVLFLGKVNDIEELLSKSRIFILPSYGEGFPNVLCEAMSIGLPCLSFDIIAGPSDIIENEKNGYLIEDGDLHEMANKVNYLIGHPEEQIRLGIEATKITEKFSLQKIGDNYLDFILETIN